MSVTSYHSALGISFFEIQKQRTFSSSFSPTSPSWSPETALTCTADTGAKRDALRRTARARKGRTCRTSKMLTAFPEKQEQRTEKGCTNDGLPMRAVLTGEIVDEELGLSGDDTIVVKLALRNLESELDHKFDWFTF